MLPIGIGRADPDADAAAPAEADAAVTTDADPVAVLVACHGKIRRFLRLAAEVGAHPDAPRRDLEAACAGVARYFETALPLHVADEEESILPRLRGRSARLDAALARMSDEHAGHAQALAELRGAVAAVAAAPGSPAPHRRLHIAAGVLEAVLEPHLQAEEETVFPALRTALAPAARDAILREMRDRRAPRDAPDPG